MTIGRIRASILVAGALVAFVAAPQAHADTNKKAQKCLLSTARASQKYLAGKLKLLEKCKNQNLKDGSCPTPDPTALGKLSSKLASSIGKACTLSAPDFKATGFPGPCPDPNPGDGFTVADLQACMANAHDAFITAFMGLAYDSTITGPLGDTDQKCQAEVAKQAGAYANCLVKNVGKCREAFLKGKLPNVPPDFCATDDPKTSGAIQKCVEKLTTGIGKKCDAGQITSLKVCTPDQSSTAGAASCLVSAQTPLLDGPEIIVPPDIIDYEYAVRGGICGDGIVNNLNEECDIPDDAACPGQCGTAETPDGFFACLCKTKPRMVVEEHADADTDNGYTGRSSDGKVVEGGGYPVDLYDCDMTGLCIVGPNCSLAPHSSCAVSDEAPFGTTSDSICANLGQGVCRKERTANGPHCYQDPGKKCDLRQAGDPNDPSAVGPATTA